MLEQCKACARHLTGLSLAPVWGVDVLQKKFLEQTGAAEGWFCSYCHKENCNPLNTCLYGCNEALRWNGKYIYYCPMGMVFVASPLCDEQGRLAFGLVAGPILMGEPEDYSEQDGIFADDLKLLPVFSTARVNNLAETMALLTTGISGRTHNLAGTVIYEQEKVLNELYSAGQKFREGNTAYPIDTEKKLQAMIYRKDKKGSQQLLNELLGHIYFVAEYDLDVMKARALELAVVISRATIEAGADLNEIFVCNENFIKEVERLSSVEEIGAWLSTLMHRFIDYSFDFSHIKHSDVVFKAAEYVKNHFAEKITLDDAAAYVCLSKSYLSRIFKEETGESLSSFINKVRIDKAKLMLLDNDSALVEVASECGFEDQSYFTKVFKRQVGVSPKRYRESRGNITLTAQKENGYEHIR
ncbi:MAG: helix-turn-helix domain-containing protein [Oscillospiraceae bacterium]|jgi:two-component system response regulator YesN